MASGRNRYLSCKGVSVVMDDLPPVPYDQVKSDREWRHRRYKSNKGKCELCGVETFEEYVVVDHDHKTGIVRGVNL